MQDQTGNKKHNTMKTPKKVEVKAVKLSPKDKPKVLGTAYGVGELKPYKFYAEKWGNMRNPNDKPEVRARKKTTLDQAWAKEKGKKK